MVDANGRRGPVMIAMLGPGAYARSLHPGQDRFIWNRRKPRPRKSWKRQHDFEYFRSALL